MTRANDATQVDYSLLDDRQLGDAVAENVLELEQVVVDELDGDEFVSWWGAGLVIDNLRAEGMCWSIEDYVGFTVVEVSYPYSEEYEGAATSNSPIRAILLAALRAKEVQT